MRAMPKIVINRGNAKESKLITARTSEISAALREIAESEFIETSDIMKYLGCSRRSVSRYTGKQDKHQLSAVRKACGTRKYRSIDVARRLAELEVLS
jgi:DNA invertase Pin-like site-specific DNA recombinase